MRLLFGMCKSDLGLAILAMSFRAESEASTEAEFLTPAGLAALKALVARDADVAADDPSLPSLVSKDYARVEGTIACITVSGHIRYLNALSATFDKQ